MNMKLTNTNSVAMFAIWILFFGSLSIGIASEPMSKPLFDFSDASVAKQWLSVNDNVMGGVSKGGFRITDDKTLEFSGNTHIRHTHGSEKEKHADYLFDLHIHASLRILLVGHSIPWPPCFGLLFFFDAR